MGKYIYIRCDNCNKVERIYKAKYTKLCREWGQYECHDCGRGLMEPCYDTDSDTQWYCDQCRKWIDDSDVRDEDDWDDYDATYDCPECGNELMSQDHVDEIRAEFADGTVNGLRQDAEGNWCYDLDYPEDE